MAISPADLELPPTQPLDLTALNDQLLAGPAAARASRDPAAGSSALVQEPGGRFRDSDSDSDSDSDAA